MCACAEGMDGVQCARLIFEHCAAAAADDVCSVEWKRPYILACTANADTATRERCYSVGMQEFIVKPLRVPLVQAALQKSVQSITHPAPV